ncbi:MULTISPECIES: DUF262 domain-containing protein [Pectobacterium]|uniref:DUF262 domain-containing protein n=1 Tax=Pectobacterium TaxID=122277 RepID=UPI0015DE33C5|nr:MULTISPECIES: DUF262 domain-containing protein [Pectobacterium]MBA0170524.1 DUF262 domain-containing protein [Pectobacterium versatile]MBA0181976.1 DUF262 domain-containing protein [Pectobacterium carotovorum]MBN3239494.1 DUF262 domain-containing protein [Pectobacterium versatile]MBQ4788673.1 DUF262 domain-containing protein [Pectobacterium versatile]MCA6924853.1 DUF262 domain-containing protein [Pectobacterium versatile]
MDVLKRDSNSINIASFWEGYSLNKFNFDPPYQRDSVWDEEKQSFFIDSILRNYPVPPIFLHQKIDDDSGRITFEIVDGKQRLTAIVNFIKGNIASSSEEDDDELTGVFFDDLSKENLSEIKKLFWRYQMPVEYIDTEDEKTIDSIFDRLNRNGERLNGQELRNAKYHKTEFYKNIIELSQLSFWQKLLEHVDKKRMEDKEFVSELVFTILENQVFGATQDIIDELYEKYCNLDYSKNQHAFNKFIEITDYLKKMNVDFKDFKASGVSHLYGFFNYALHCYDNNIDPNKAANILTDFLRSLWNKSDKNNENLRIEYRKTMSSSTKSKSQRNHRIQVLINLTK